MTVIRKKEKKTRKRKKIIIKGKSKGKRKKIKIKIIKTRWKDRQSRRGEEGGGKEGRDERRVDGDTQEICLTRL